VRRHLGKTRKDVNAVAGVQLRLESVSPKPRNANPFRGVNASIQMKPFVPCLPLSFPHKRSRLLGSVALGIALVAPLAAEAAQSKKAKEPKDSAPILMSKTGGGDSWADLAELQQAAKKGNPKAETQLGEMLLRGDGIAKDEARGIALIEKAARAGQSPAAFRIGMLLMNGESGVAKDPARALAYFRAAAAGGEAEAFFNIGAAYASGRGVKRDYGEALGWLILARQHGATAQAEQSLRAQLKGTPQIIAAGERRAKQIEAEFAGKKVADFLPAPAPLDQSVAALPKSR
jgi:hypothetical protein